MSIPLAVSPSIVTPGLYLTVDLLAGAASPSVGTLKILLMAPKSAAGDLTDDTEVRSGGGASSGAIAFGNGTPGHLTAKKIYEQFPQAQVDFISPAAGAGQADLDITFGGAPSSNVAIDCDIAGREFEIAWLVGESVTEIRDKFIAAVQQRTSDLPVTAADGGAGIATINSKLLGNHGNDILVQVRLRSAQTGTETVTGATSATALAGGTTDPDFANAIASISGEEYHVIVPCLSNADVENTTGNLSDLETYIDQNDSGRSAKLQQVVVGYTGSLASAKTSAIARNSGVFELVLCVNGRGLPGELGGVEAGDRVAFESIDPASNRIGNALGSYIGAKDVIADKPTDAETEDALTNGVAIVTYTAQGDEIIARPITTLSQDASGGADRRLLDVQNVSATYIVARDLRSALPAQFPNAKITPDTPPGEDPPPAGVIEERDIKAFIISRLRFWQRSGVITQASLDAAIADGTLIVKVNESDATQVDIVIPFKIVPPLAKMGVVVQRLPN
jgi:phage tail sheath gpL-like